MASRSDLLPQQVLMYDHLINNPCAILNVDMGLGKTRATLEALGHLVIEGVAKGALIVAPLRVASLTWPMEVRKWLPWMKVVELRNDRDLKQWEKGEGVIYILNYELLPWFCDNVDRKKDFPVDIVIWDELSKCKSHTSKRIKKFLGLRDKFIIHWGLTGTLIANGYLDIFAPIRLIDGGLRLGNNFHAFKNRYFETDYMGWNTTIRSFSKDIIEGKITDLILTCRAEEYAGIPPIITEDIDVKLSNVVMKDYRKMERDMLLRIKEKTIDGKNAAVLVGKLLQLCSGQIYDETRTIIDIHDEKLKALEKLIKGAKKGENILLATMYIHERERIMEYFVDDEFELWDGDETLDRWNKGKIKVLVVDPRSIGHGLNMQDGGHRIIWYTPTYSRELYDQTNARLARTGQKNNVLVQRLLCTDTIDWAVAEALRIKGDELSGLKNALEVLESMR